MHVATLAAVERGMSPSRRQADKIRAALLRLGVPVAEVADIKELKIAGDNGETVKRSARLQN